MEEAAKRKRPDERSEQEKEPCPHGESCYRRNPHHFKEFGHPHLMNYVEKGDSAIPDNGPQPKSVYIEQLHVLKGLLKLKIEMATQTDTRSNTPLCTPSTSSFNHAQTSTARKIKKTSFVSDVKSSESGSQTGDQLMSDRLKKVAPYNIFFTTIPKSKETLEQDNCITFSDLLCPSLGTLKCSLQVNFMIDVSWLIEQYQVKNVHLKPLTIVYGSDDFPKMEEYMDRFLPNVTYHYMKLKDPYGIHHSKVGIYLYEDESLRVVVSTANLYYEDWNHYNQGLWLSQACPKLADPGPGKGESPTGFKKSLLEYLKIYNIPCLAQWIKYVENADFSDIKVFLVYSTPGKHYPESSGSHLHHVAHLLKQHCSLPAKTTPESEGPLSWGIIAQSSSIGSLGKSPSEWLRSVFLRSLSAHQGASLTSNSNATLSMVYPSVDNVMTGYFGAESGGCLPYSKALNEKQRWFQEYLHQWKADGLNRSQAMPHIKSYCRVSPCLSKLAYFLLTSANLSKAAWGSHILKDGSVSTRSYEVGVMFLPSFFDEDYFHIKPTEGVSNVFPFMYDLPLTSYAKDDYPWCN